MSPMPEFTHEVQILEERIEEGLNRLGAHFEKDSRSKNFPIQQWIVDKGGTYQSDPTKLSSKTWHRDIPVLDQGALGSCTGNAATGMVGTSPVFDKDQTRFKGLVEDEGFAVRVYERATRLDGIGQPFYPPSDRGSTSLGALKAVQSMGLIDQYRWGFGLVDALNALAIVGAGITGVPWYEGFDSPNADGTLTIAGNVRGGHELVLDEIDVPNRLVWGTNSWGESWDEGGRFAWSWETYDQLLQQQGDFGIGIWR